MAVHPTTPVPATSTEDTTPLMVQAMLQLEHTRSLDRLVAKVSPAAAALVKDPKVAAVLHGKAAGHAAHPVLTDIPIGTWLSAFVLDLIGGKRSRPAATRLIGVGILAAVPTAVTGLAEWAVTTDTPSRRVGVVHAAANTVGLALYTSSFRSRRHGRHLRGVLTSLAGLTVVGASGYLGAHLSLARKVATRDVAFAAQVPLGGDAVPVPGEPVGTSGTTGGVGAEGSGGGRHRGESSDPAAAI